jgi:hypothetical protein
MDSETADHSRGGGGLVCFSIEFEYDWKGGLVCFSIEFEYDWKGGLVCFSIEFEYDWKGGLVWFRIEFECDWGSILCGIFSIFFNWWRFSIDGCLQFVEEMVSIIYYCTTFQLKIFHYDSINKY